MFIPSERQEAMMMVQLVKDLEATRFYVHGYAYVRTIRNILTGNENAVIAPNFADKEYYGIYDYLGLQQVERMFNRIAELGLLEYVYTDRGKLYCTHEYRVEYDRKVLCA